MKKTSAPNHKTPTPTPAAGPKARAAQPDPNPTAIFVSAALDMSWRLAIVVLVPVIGGFELDKRLHTTPVITVLGFVAALAGMVLVLRQSIKTVAENAPPAKRGKT